MRFGVSTPQAAIIADFLLSKNQKFKYTCCILHSASCFASSMQRFVRNAGCATHQTNRRAFVTSVLPSKPRLQTICAPLSSSGVALLMPMRRQVDYVCNAASKSDSNALLTNIAHRQSNGNGKCIGASLPAQDNGTLLFPAAHEHVGREGVDFRRFLQVSTCFLALRARVKCLGPLYYQVPLLTISETVTPSVTSELRCHKCLRGKPFTCLSIIRLQLHNQSLLLPYARRPDVGMLVFRTSWGSIVSIPNPTAPQQPLQQQQPPLPPQHQPLPPAQQWG